MNALLLLWCAHAFSTDMEKSDLRDTNCGGFKCGIPLKDNLMLLITHKSQSGIDKPLTISDLIDEYNAMKKIETLGMKTILLPNDESKPQISEFTSEALKKLGIKEENEQLFIEQKGDLHSVPLDFQKVGEKYAVNCFKVRFIDGEVIQLAKWSIYSKIWFLVQLRKFLLGNAYQLSNETKQNLDEDLTRLLNISLKWTIPDLQVLVDAQGNVFVFDPWGEIYDHGNAIIRENVTVFKKSIQYFWYPSKIEELENWIKTAGSNQRWATKIWKIGSDIPKVGKYWNWEPEVFDEETEEDIPNVVPAIIDFRLPLKSEGWHFEYDFLDQRDGEMYHARFF